MSSPTATLATGSRSWAPHGAAWRRCEPSSARSRATRLAEDPWAVITHAVHLSLVYESRARGLLCSTQQARHSSGTGYHDAELVYGPGPAIPGTKYLLPPLKPTTSWGNVGPTMTTWSWSSTARSTICSPWRVTL